MRRPQHRDVPEAASETMSIDPDLASAEHETACDRRKDKINRLKAAATTRAISTERGGPRPGNSECEDWEQTLTPT